MLYSCTLLFMYRLFLIISLACLLTTTTNGQTMPAFKAVGSDTLITNLPGQPGFQNVVIKDYNKQVTETGQYLNGLRHGQWVTLYQPDSLIHTLSIYEKGLLNGLSLSFEKNMQLEDEANYANGKLNGIHRAYKHGKVEILENYQNGQLHGSYLKYHSNGKIQEQSTYKNGLKNGKATWYYDNGELLTEYNYVNGNINGKIQSFYKDKTLRTETEYLNNEMNGLFKSYYENGKPKEEGRYVNGKKNDEWKYFNEEGKPVKTVQYKMGAVVKETPLNK
ncbi:toxin-antitoxin system YwqK family antitoxin [Sphingobacteriales bacterium UPWRP_1]|nr:hypothetical protein B6N25_10095 [Sphingobacteriales bacterium TSM_CSS]PSJ76408.1 toxin-antitoxin system YwqK family antitoxin [Sphingobacteriales bacterium UPWRP_1]